MSDSRLFVGGLDWKTDEVRLREVFEDFGNVMEVKVIQDRDTGRSRGFGFVTFDEVEGAQRAIEKLDGKELDGRTVKVNLAENKGPRKTFNRQRSW